MLPIQSQAQIFSSVLFLKYPDYVITSEHKNGF